MSIYKNPEKRKQYLIEWRKRNRSRLTEKYRTYQRNYMREYRGNGINTNVFLGKCGMGRRFEKIALQFLKNSVDCNNTSFHGAWDIEWNNLKIDVKARKISKKYKGFTFVDSSNKKATHILAFCVDKNEKILEVAFVPTKDFKTGFCIPADKKTNKYSKYIINIKSFNLN